mgnify:CR=1 FL=1
MNHEEKAAAPAVCVLRLFGVAAERVQLAAQETGLAAQCRAQGAETLLALQAATPAGLDAAKRQLHAQFAAELYGEGETTLVHAAVQALEARRRLLVCADASAGALLETRLETVAAAERVFDFGAMSYADEKTRAKLDAKTRRVKGGAAAMALARVQATQRLSGAAYAAGCVERAEDTVLFLGGRKGCWVRTAANSDAPALWLLDMIRRAASGLPQAAGTSWQKYGRAVPADVLTVQTLPDKPENTAPAKPPRKRHRMRNALIFLLVLALAAFAAAWHYTGGDLTALPQRLQSLGADSLPHAGAKLI